MDTPKPMELPHVYGALVGLIQALTKLAENANRAIDEDRAQHKSK